MLTPHCLIIDDDMSTYHCAQAANIQCTPCTHFELISQKGQEHFRKLHSREYNMLWLTIPLNYYYRNAPPGSASIQIKQRFTSHQSRLSTFINTARKVGCHVNVFGQPGKPWLPYKNDLAKLHIHFREIHLCSIDECFDRASGKPSRSYLQLATTMPIGDQWTCSCKATQDQHVLDWFGDDEAHAEFRRKARGVALASIWQSFKDKVTDLTFPSPCQLLHS